MFTRKTTLYAKIEAPSGTDSTPTAAANAIMAFDVDLSTKADMKARNAGHADRSEYAAIRGKTTMELKFKIELKGSGTAGTAPRWAPLVQACDRLETTSVGVSVIYSMALVSQTCTIYVNIDGIMHKLVGCAGDCEIDLNAGDVPWLIFTMSGVYAMPADDPIVAQTFDTSVAQIVKATTTTFGSYAAIIEKLNLKFGNSVIERSSMAAIEAVLAFMVGNRNPTGVMTCEAVLRATSNADFHSYFNTGGTKALSMVLSGGAGNIVTIAAPTCLITGIKYGDREGLRTFDVEFNCARSAGNDEMTITLT